MLRRIAAELRSSPDLASSYVPVTFSEESYGVTSAGEFWLEAVERLAGERDSAELRRIAKEIREQHDDVSIREQALSHLLAYAQEANIRIVLMVENLTMLLSDQMRMGAAWELRHTFANESSILLIGTSLKNIFSGALQSGGAWFEMFSVYHLGPLDSSDCERLWRSITGTEMSSSQLRPIEILTGGNPRLIGILAEFHKSSSLSLLLKSLIKLIDEHTEYFKSQLDSLPAVERKVFVAVLDAWTPVTASEIADISRISPKQCSALLNRLVSRGAITVSGPPTRKRYQAAERLFNVYYLLRKGGHPSQRIRAAVRFMTVFYEQEELVQSTLRIALEACRMEPHARHDHYLAYDEILRQAEEDRRYDLASEIISHTPDEFFRSDQLPDSVRDHVGELRHREKDNSLPMDYELLHKLLARANAIEGSGTEKEEALRELLKEHPHFGHGWAHLGEFLLKSRNRLSEALEALRTAVAESPNDHWAWHLYGSALLRSGQDDQGTAALRTSIGLRLDYPYGYLRLGGFFHDKGLYRQAEEVLREGVRSVKENAAAPLYENLGELYRYHMNQPEKAEATYRRALELGEDRSGNVSLELGELSLINNDDFRAAEPFFVRAEKTFRQQISKRPSDDEAWYGLSQVLANFPQKMGEAEEAIRKAIEIHPNKAQYWNHLMDCLVGNDRLSLAVQAAKDAVTRMPQGDSWRRLGWVYQYAGDYEKALSAYRKAVKLEPNHIEAWERLSEVLLYLGGKNRIVEAKGALKKVVNARGAAASVWPTLLQIMAEDGDGSTEIINAAKNFVDAHRRDSAALVAAAESIYVSSRTDLAKIAESMAREALNNDGSDAADASYLLARIYLDRREITASLQFMKSIVDDADKDRKAVDRVIRFTIRAAGMGFANEVLVLLRASLSHQAFEPLDVALSKVTGSEILAPQELSEIAEDIVKRIERQRNLFRRDNPSQ
jgi:cytochrome c-type biogenesis protein CcmH/NrfG